MSKFSTNVFPQSAIEVQNTAMNEKATVMGAIRRVDARIIRLLGANLCWLPEQVADS